MKRLASVLVSALLCSHSARAHADEGAPPSAPEPTVPDAPAPIVLAHEPARSQLHLTVGFSVGGTSSRGSDYNGGATARIEGAVGYSVLRAGVLFDASSALLSSHRAGAGLTLGVSLPAGPLVFDARGITGWRAYSGVGRSAFSFGDSTPDPGASGAAAYAGLEVGVGVSPSGMRVRDGRACIGLSLYLGRDISATKSTYTYSNTHDSGWLGNGPVYTETRGSTHTIGGATELGLALRVTFDFNPSR
jgi:hypothetical protein